MGGRSSLSYDFKQNEHCHSVAPCRSCGGLHAAALVKKGPEGLLSRTAAVPFAVTDL